MGTSEPENRPPSDIHKRTTTLPGGGALPVRLGHFRVRRLIASGPSGTVYEAEQDHPRRLVTLRLPAPGPVSEAVRRRFDEEAQILAGLHHPAIAQVYEAGTLAAPDSEGTAEGIPYIAVEHVPAVRNLLEHARDRRLSLAQRLELFSAVCDAVQHGHQRGIVHCAIRPGNVLIDADGKPRIIDFGFRRTLSPEDPGDGTPADEAGAAYTAPELLRRDLTEPDLRSDVYSLGVLLYELLTDRLPYDPDEMVPRGPGLAPGAEPARPSTLNAAVKGDPEMIILKAMHRDPARRYATAGNLGADVRGYLGSRPIGDPPRHIAYILRTMLRAAVARHPVPATILAIGAAWLLANWPGIPLVFTWTPLGLWFERGAAAFVPGSTLPPLTHVRIIAVGDDTDPAALGEAAGMTGISNEEPQKWTMRPLHGRLMERLAASGAPSVLAWDMYFPSERPGDAAFAGGVRALHERKIPVVVGVYPWTLDPAREPGIAPLILASGVRWGGATIDADGTGPWKIDALAWRAEHEPQPAFVLEAFAASIEPGADAVYRVERRRGDVEIRFRAARAGSSRHGEVGRARVTLSEVGEVDEDGDGLRAGDGLALLVLPMPADETFRAATIPYERVLRASAEELRAWFGGKAVIVADLRDRRDVSAHPDGRVLPRAYAHAVALDILLRGAVIRLPRPAHITWLVLGGGVIGAAIPWRVRGRAARVMVVLTAGALMLAASLLMFGYAQYLCNPLVPLLSLLVAAGAASWVVRARDSRALRTI